MIVDLYGKGRSRCLAELVRTPGFKQLRIYEPGTIGPFRAQLVGLPYYRQSDFHPDATRQSATQALPHQDLQALSWPDRSFDLVITSDVLEHVRHPQRALSEIARILVPGGYHVCTVPLQDPLRPASVFRVDTSGETDVPLLEERYHGNGKGGRSLVYTDFGEDLLEMILDTGTSARFERGRTESAIANAAVTVVSWKTPPRS
ncbi:MAG: methyltransferase domain-containing protein [Thiohalocapsa sp.]